MTITNVTKNMVIRANFDRNLYTVTFKVDSNGSITGTLVQAIKHGYNCTIVTAVSAIGFHFTGWSGDYIGTTNPLTITNVTKNMTITANFAVNIYTVTFIAGLNGSLTGDLTQSVTHNGNCTPVTAVPISGYKFKGWSGDFTGTQNPLTLTKVTSNKMIMANFDIATVIQNGNLNSLVTHTFSVYPNPVKTGERVSFVFTGEFKCGATLVIYSPLGDILFQKKFTPYSIAGPQKFVVWDLKDLYGTYLPGGTYLAVFAVENGNKYVQMIGVKTMK